MIRTQVYLPDDLHRELTLLAQASDKNLSELIREGARQIIKKRAAKKKKDAKSFIGAIKSGPRKSGVEVINDYYRDF